MPALEVKGTLRLRRLGSVPTIGVPTIDVASNCDPPGPEDPSEGGIIDSEGDPADAGIPILDKLKCLRRNSETTMSSLWPQDL